MARALHLTVSQRHKEAAMKIEQSAVAMTASHSFSSEYAVSSETTGSFRTLFDGAAQTSALAAIS